ncbi:MAG: hypothetical protein LZF64_09765 [Nitrosomonas sp.]|nr:MAG: hypothetical protein LZF64_09765 [Nitrosomonas sp.]
MGQSPVLLKDSRGLTLYLSQRVSNNFRLNIYGLKGFSERSPVLRSVRLALHLVR